MRTCSAVQSVFVLAPTLDHVNPPGDVAAIEAALPLPPMLLKLPPT